MRLLLSRETIKAKPELLAEFIAGVSEDVDFLRASYPSFDTWLRDKVIPGVYAGERTAIVERRDSITVGILIVKHTALEKKLCTLRVRPAFESRGLGVRLFEAAFDLLGTEQPLLSVSESSKPRFARLFAHFGFSQEAVYKGRYLPRVQEFAYNGLLDAPGRCISALDPFKACRPEAIEWSRPLVVARDAHRRLEISPEHLSKRSLAAYLDPNPLTVSDRLLIAA